MFLDTLENYVDEEEAIRTIAAMIVNDGKSDEELSFIGYSEELIERAHIHVLSVYY